MLENVNYRSAPKKLGKLLFFPNQIKWFSVLTMLKSEKNQFFPAKIYKLKILLDKQEVCWFSHRKLTLNPNFTTLMNKSDNYEK